jgi:hypothetical protein
LGTWLGESPESRQNKSARTTTVTFLPAVVIPDIPREATSRIVLNSPRGYCVEGLDLGALVELLGRIG